MQRREEEEGYAPGPLSTLTEMNLQILGQRVHQCLAPDHRDRLEIRTYNDTIRFNIMIVDRAVAVIQPYMPNPARHRVTHASHSVPLCGVSLALIGGDQPLPGVIDHPHLSARYTAAKGHGAHRNGKPIHVSNVEGRTDASIALSNKTSRVHRTCQDSPVPGRSSRTAPCCRAVASGPAGARTLTRCYADQADCPDSRNGIAEIFFS